ncbi:hypothetical protein [Metabacillus sp. RGM 3146]|uniref:hypothetical protein n=1 Tax=Metabacillus sp. RGM 3146 TaxID=3401092 RepID=UPI003B9C24A1
MTDWLLAIDQVAEREEEYPVYNVLKRTRDARKRAAKELAIVTLDSDEDTLPPFTVEEKAISVRDPIEEIFFSEDKAESVEEFTALIEKVKTEEDYYVNKYADESPWNEKQPKKKRTFREVRSAIRKLDTNRIRVCKECNGAFYAHDGRRHVCDVQKYPGNNLSACEVKIHRKRSDSRYLAQKKAIM